ncbi:sensor histidine kinase [Aquimarina algicola]|uniref:Signal transduction histidine kinase internal region domain-containing protein n=1 Tax=Aquimarina algicola TaxID=2589995 RepID=A0A504JLJ2_9FLAO|nr:histidine kinase [Aquimarina algicola]TPN87370.1 hypothetical protein FHK87_07225 [Aquimarina algicola]
MKTLNSYQKFIRIEPWFHIFLWSIVLFYPYLKYAERENGYMMSFAHELNSLFFKMTISYFFYFWFFPKQNKKRYLFWAFLAIFINAILYQYADMYFHAEEDHYFWQHFFANVLTYVSFSVVFFAVYSVKSMYLQQVQLDTLSQGKKQAEIDALKAHINPHFLFNTLNTIYANALKQDERTPELILKLSNGFRYLFHEGKQEYVTFKQEVQHLTDYIELQQERLSDKVEVRFNVDIDDMQKQIAPLLLIPFVENAFKYTSILKGKKHPVTIILNSSRRNFLFTCTNFFNADAKDTIDMNWLESGIGIANVKDRLQLLYPERHKLEIDQESSTYTINLSITL